MRAAAAFPALFSSMKLMVEFTSSKTRIPRKSSQSGGRPCPLANTIAINAADSITHDNGFHMKPRNLRILFSFFSSSLFEPKMASRLLPSSVVRPSLLHLSWENTSSTGMCSYSHPGARKVDQTTTHTACTELAHIFSRFFLSLSLNRHSFLSSPIW
jgi:hypothetical protein